MAGPPKPSGERDKARALRDAEAKTALREHAQRAEAEREKTARLRALRLARDAEAVAGSNAAKPSRKKAPAAKG